MKRRFSIRFRFSTGSDSQSNDTRNLQSDVVGAAMFLGKANQRLTRIRWSLRTEDVLQFHFRQLAPESVGADQKNVRLFQGQWFGGKIRLNLVGNSKRGRQHVLLGMVLSVFLPEDAGLN